MSTSGFEAVLEVLRSVCPDDGALSTEHSSEFNFHREAQAVSETEVPPSPSHWCDICAAAYQLTSRTKLAESTCACTQLQALTAARVRHAQHVPEPLLRRQQAGCD